MAVSTGFPGFSTRKNRIPIGPQNPMDKSTVVSIYPIDLDERKQTIQPGRFIIPAGTRKQPSILIVGTSTYWVDKDEDNVFEVANSSVQVANSIVLDYRIGIQEASHSDDIGPGLFWIAGCRFNEDGHSADYNKTLKWVMSDFSKRLDAAETGQREWYLRLVNQADSLWAQSNGNPLAISSLMKMAARELEITDKEWLKNYKEAEKQTCKACGFRANPDAILCQNCRFILQPEKYKEISSQFAVMPPANFDPGQLRK